MPAPYGVTSTGFNGKTLAEVRADLVSAARRVFGPGANTDSRARLGQFIDIVSEQLSDVWNLGAALSIALNPAAATGSQLDFLAALTGVVRKPAAKTRVTLYAFGTSGTVIAAGKRVGQLGTSALFETIASNTIATLTEYSYAPLTSISLGQLAKNTASTTIWRARNSGTLTTGVFGGSALVTSFTEGTVTWDRLAVGELNAVEMIADCTVTGAVQAFAASCTVINTPVAGWSSVVNLLDGVVGNDLESDSSLRVRRLQQLAAAGKSPIDAIRSAILATTGVTSCTMFENTSDVTVGLLPPHSFEALVEGGTDAAIRATLFASASGGIAKNGTTTGTVTASDGQSHVVNFSRPTAVPIYSAISVSVDITKFPVDGATQIQTAVLAAIASHIIGADVYATRIASAAFTVAGVLSSTATVGTAPSPVASSVSINSRSRASNTGTVTVSAVPGTP